MSIFCLRATKANPSTGANQSGLCHFEAERHLQAPLLGISFLTLS
jgi:hypothetical protein